MPKNEDIYKILIGYIEEDNKFKIALREDIAEIKGDLNAVKTQTTLTNGRVTKLEQKVEVLEKVEEKRNNNFELNWKWGVAIVLVVQFIITYFKEYILK